MTAPNPNLWMAHYYLINLFPVPIESFGKHDERLIELCRKILDNKARELSRYKLSKTALCSDASKVTPRMSICARCPAISASPDGCGYMCAITCKAVEEFGINNDYPNTLAKEKINPQSERSRTYTAGGTDHE